MMKFCRIRKTLLPFLVVAALVPMACRGLVMVFSHAQGFGANFSGSISRTTAKTFGRTFLHNLNSQSVEVGAKFSGDQPFLSRTTDTREALSFVWIARQTVIVDFRNPSNPSAASLPLRI